MDAPTQKIINSKTTRCATYIYNCNVDIYIMLYSRLVYINIFIHLAIVTFIYMHAARLNQSYGNSRSKSTLSKFLVSRFNEFVVIEIYHYITTIYMRERERTTTFKDFQTKGLLLNILLNFCCRLVIELA